MFDAEVLRAVVDGGAYGIVVEAEGVLRHFQQTAPFNGSRTSPQNVYAKFAEKPSGCVA